MAGIWDEKIKGSRQQAETARKLREGIKAPEGQMVSGIYVAPSLTQYLAEGLRGYSAMKDQQQAEEQAKQYEQQKAADVESINRQLTQPVQQSTVSDVGPQMPTRAPNERERMAAILRGVQVAPEQFEPMMQAEQWQQGFEDRQQAREDAMAARRDQIASSEALRREQMGMQREMQQERLQAQQEMSRQAAADRRALAGLAQSNRQAQGGGIGWKYDSGSDMWVAPPSAQFPQGISTASAPRMKSAENFSYLANQMLGTREKPGEIYKTTTGGWMGLGGQIGKVTDSQQQRRFNNLREQMSTELRTIFRIPGEGALSDKEQAQYGVQLPDIGNDPNVNAQIIQDLNYRIQNKTSPGANPLSQPSPATPAGVIRYDSQGRRIQ